MSRRTDLIPVSARARPWAWPIAYCWPTGRFRSDDGSCDRHAYRRRDGLADHKGGLRSLLHLVTDWPGYFPNGPEIVRLVIEAGADPSFRHPTRCDETPLHWTASSDDVDVAAALIDGGADLDTPGGSMSS
jgi:hypothetical protein